MEVEEVEVEVVGDSDNVKEQTPMGSDLWVWMSLTDKLTKRPCADLTDLTLTQYQLIMPIGQA